MDPVAAVLGSPPRAGRREWIGLAVLALPTLLLSLDLSVLYLALPQLSADLHPSSAQLLWITDVYGFLIAGFLITMGTLGDRIGRRRLLMVGAVAFGAASVLAAFSTSAEMLIAARALLGVAGATQMPATLALIRTMFVDPGQRAVGIAVWVSYWTAGAAIGPVVGGVMLEAFWWGSVFLLGVPVMLVLLVAAPLLLPESRDPDAGRLDPVSVGLSLAAILPFVYGLKDLAESGAQAGAVLAMVAGVVFGVLFVRRQRVLSNPLLNLKLFGNRGFTTALVIMAVGLVTLGGMYLFVTQYLQAVVGLSPLRAAAWLLVAAIADVVTAMLAPVLARRINPGHIVATGLVLAAAGYVLLAVTNPVSTLAIPVAGLILIQAGVGPVVTLGTDLVVGSVPPQTAGAASSISETSAEFGIAMGIAVLGAAGTAVYRDKIADAIPGDVPVEVAHAARENIGGAINAAQHLAPALRADLLHGAREAFTTGMHVVAALNALLSIALAVLAATTLRKTPPTHSTPTPTQTHPSGPPDGT